MEHNPYRDDVVISWAELHRDTRRLCHELMAKGPFKGIIAIARGGLIPSALITTSSGAAGAWLLLPTLGRSTLPVWISGAVTMKITRRTSMTSM